MNFEEEILLLIKSRYPLVSVDTVDEDYVLDQLREAARAQGHAFYAWSLTKGLRVGDSENSFYKTNDAVGMLRIVNDLLEQPRSAVFALCDFVRYLQDDTAARLFKDILDRIKGSPTTVALLAYGAKLPDDIAPLAAVIQGGYPDEKDIMEEINRAVMEFRASSPALSVNVPPEVLRRMVKTLKGLSRQQIRNVLNLCLTKDAVFDASDIAEMEKFKKEAFDRDGILEYFGSESEDSIAGFDSLKRWARDRRGAFFTDGPLPPPKGALLLGVQGCGKSLAAKVISGVLGVPLYRLDLTRLYSKYIGETEENLRKALSTVERLAPVCLWVDEIEKIFASSSGDVDGGVSKRVLGTMLTWMQERKDRSFIAATSNDIENLPAELLRKGRFDEIFFADLPDEPAREGILFIHLKKRGLDPAKFDLKALAAACQGFSGSEIEQAVISALYSASGAGMPIATPHVLEQLRLTRPLSVVKADAVNFIRNWAKERNILPV